MLLFILVEKLLLVFTHIGSGEEVAEVDGGASDMGVDRIGEVGGRDSEGQASGMFGACFKVVSLARVGARDQGSNMELMEVWRMAEGN